MSDIVATASTPRITPTVSQPIRSDWASWISQFIAHEDAMIKKLANEGVAMAENAIPGGYFIKLFVTEKLIDEWVDQGEKALEGIIDTSLPSTTGSATDHPLAGYVINMFNTVVPELASHVAPDFDRLLSAGLAKIGMKA